MKLRLFQTQVFLKTCVDARKGYYTERWFDEGNPVLQYLGESGWEDVPTVSTSEEEYGER